jgi:GNAT superfamily N-acetyltransferase
VSDFECLPLIGDDIAPHIPALARLRLRVFRDFPYLYDGDFAYEEAYLRDYAQAPGALLVLVLARGEAVGASTGMPLVHAHAEFSAPFRAAGVDPARVFYFGESVLHPDWRGRGLGHAFFDARETHARALPGVDITTFCAVERPPDHPRRPPDYRPLDAFWRKRGYVRRPDWVARFAWKDLDAAQPSEKPLVFWTREWAAPPPPEVGSGA